MALFTVADAIARKVEQNHKTDYEWFVELPDLDLGSINSASLAYKKSGGFFSGVGNAILAGAAAVGESSTDQSLISHRVYGIDTPYDGIETSKNTEKASFWYSAMQSDIGNVTLRLDEMEDCMTLQYINDWFALLSNDDGTRNPPVNYKRNITFYQLNRKKDEIHKSVYIGYFPVEVSPISWSYDGSSVLQYSLVLTGDSVTHEKLPASFFDKYN